MSTTTRITIDDEGDTLIILKLRSDDSNPDVTDIIATADESTIETTTETTATSNVTTDDAVQTNKSTYQIIHASFVFENSEAFKRATKLAIQFGTDIVPTFELPIRQSVIDSIETKRVFIFQELMDGSMMLGTLIQESGAYASIFSGKWHRATSSLPIQRQDNASATPEHPQRKFAVATGTAGRIYSGTSMTPQNPTSTQGSRSPWPNVGGNTGTVTPFWGHNGLTPSAAATESQEGPSTLVQHHCCLMDCLKPMLDAVEGKIEGLKLEEFTRP
ncbi:unnamed protein product [Fusarium graminearum]|nr:unnamed protein product [Fusarium graminearum]